MFYTRAGDSGETRIMGGEKASKDDVRIEAYGTVDELNSFVGNAISDTISEELRQLLTTVQNDLFTVGAELSAREPKGPTVTKLFVDRIENRIAAYEKHVGKLDKFVLPQGGHLATALHVCRTTCRRAERRVVSLARTEKVNPEVVRYLNRLSSLFFVLALYVNKKEGHKETNPEY